MSTPEVDFEAIGVVLHCARQWESKLSVAREELPQRLADLGATGDGWSSENMLRAIYSDASVPTRIIIDRAYSGTLTVSFFEMLTGSW
jgi:hypothetical protein